jgi:hypothetical protein
LHILDNSPLSDVSFANIFSQSWLAFSFSWQCLLQSRKLSFEWSHTASSFFHVPFSSYLESHQHALSHLDFFPVIY